MNLSEEIQAIRDIRIFIAGIIFSSTYQIYFGKDTLQEH